MIDFFNGIFEYQFLRNAMLAALLASISCGIIGSYIVARRMVFISGGITHASFGGIGLGYFLGINPLIGAFVFSTLTALGIRVASRRSLIREDSAIGILWSLGMAIGIIFIFLTPGYAPNLMTYLFGSLLTVSTLDLYLMALLAVVTLIVFIFFYRIILFVSFDEEYARSHNAPVETVNYLLFILVSMAIVLHIRVAGIILVISFLTIPQSTANLFAKDLSRIIIYSIFISFMGSLAGLVASYYFNIPSGATIIFVFVLLFLLARTYKYFQNKIARKRLLPGS
ncbi:MAG: metal ABC transporter permease [Bacteroidales bacterium]|nr:metal ABC transporter permease [Bacteroidales bacterium]